MTGTVTTTFKQQPAIKLVLPESRHPPAGGSERDLVITVAKEAPYFYLGQTPVTADQLRAELASRAAKDPDVIVAVRTHTDSEVGKFVSVMDMVKAAGFRKPVNIFTKPAD